jgi:hypothetical protein
VKIGCKLLYRPAVYLYAAPPTRKQTFAFFTLASSIDFKGTLTVDTATRELARFAVYEAIKINTKKPYITSNNLEPLVVGSIKSLNVKVEKDLYMKSSKGFLDSAIVVIASSASSGPNAEFPPFEDGDDDDGDDDDNDDDDDDDDDEEEEEEKSSPSGFSSISFIKVIK